LDHVLKEIRGLVDRYSDNRYIASCRVAAYTFGGFTRFKDVAMAAFEDEQIEQFIKNWFQKSRDLEVDTADRCWELLNSPDYQAAKELAQTPLLLTLLCVVYDEFQDFPKKRHALYGEALDVLLRKWASEKRIQRNPIYQELSAELELDMLAEIAYTSFVDDQLFFSKDKLIEQIREFLVNNLNAPSHLDAETVLREIEIQQGILVERARDTYSFSHLTFQEYLTAKCIIDNQKTQQLVRNHAPDKNWQEVFLLAAGLSPGKSGVDDLLLMMEEQANSLMNTQKLRHLLSWSNQVTQELPERNKSFTVRTIAIYIFIVLGFDPENSHNSWVFKNNLNKIESFLFRSGIPGDFFYILDHANGFFAGIEHAHDLSRDHDWPEDIFLSLDKARDSCYFLVKEIQEMHLLKVDLSELIMKLDDFPSPPSFQNIARKQCLDFARSIEIEILRSFKIDLRSSRISSEEILKISSYFHILELMVRCKEAAVRVSPQVWESIESRMVTVPTE
jgi:hypothetical protein